MPNNKKLKVAHVFLGLNFSGAEIMYAKAAKLFIEKDIDLVAIATVKDLGGYSSQMERAGYEIKHIPLEPLAFRNIHQFIRYFYLFYKYLLSAKIDVLHIHRSTNYWFFSLAARLAKVPVVRTMHNVFRNRWWTWPKAYLERLTARRFLGVTFHSIGISVFNNEKEYYLNKSILINNWYDDGVFVGLNDMTLISSLRRRLNIPENSFVIVSAGSCTTVKRHSHILEAIALSKHSGNIFYVHLGEGPLEEAERELVKSLHLDKNVVFLGNVDNVYQYLQASDAYLMPSSFEGLSIAALEAMGCGVVPVLYDVPGLRDLIINNQTGILVDPNVSGLVRAIDWLFENKSTSKKLGESARDFVVANYSMSAGVDSILKLYRH